MKLAHVIVAAARVLEARVRSNAAAKRGARTAFAALARRSREARAFVRLRLMRLV